MTTLLRNITLCAVLVVVYATTTSAAENTDLTSGSGDIQIEMQDGSLLLKTHDALLGEIMHKLGELAGFRTILADDFIEPPRMNVSFNSIPVREAVERLVRDKNRIIFYAPSNDEAKQRSISQVWLLGPSGESGGDEPIDDEAIGSAEKKVVKEYKLVRLTKMLQENQEIEVRTRAAIALGALQDERAVFALESALLDMDASVRSQAINALGRIGSERATMVLGNILLNGSADITERVIAAQALWNLDSETARGYLRAGAYAANEQVRIASSKPSSPANAGATSDLPGNQATH